MGSGAKSSGEGALKNVAGVGGNVYAQGLPLTANYYTSLLEGGPAAQAAVAPAAESIAQEYAGAKNTIENMLPAGGEKNLALEQLPIEQAGQVARLTAGVQPAAAAALSGESLAAGGLAGQAGQSLLQYAQSVMSSIGSALGGAAEGGGTLLGAKNAGSKA